MRIGSICVGVFLNFVSYNISFFFPALGKNDCISFSKEYLLPGDSFGGQNEIPLRTVGHLL